MAASSKSSQTTKNVVIALLALWSIISLIVIVVWATSPDMKSSAQCRHELKEANVKLEGSRVMWDKNKIALEEMVEKEREEKDRQTVEIMLLLGRLNATNATLEQCRQEIVVLMGNISVLEENNEQLRQTEANLTAELRLQEDHIEILQANLTQAFHETQSCFSLKTAAESQMLAAQSQTRACESNKQYLQKKLSSCTPKSAVVKPTPPPKPQKQEEDSDSAAPPLACISALALLMCSALHLIT
ncbi:hypothetical protein EXN66_Car006208 [Channa argus]|uniref:Uncharacterized protein n=1 Tax=Channa argus TaxID=215402 RepID=A0A6G1PJS8_CHAAH|nr:hypothetical protein EXN66_Car006208 [Channa argus]KAK2908257.1 hypothetical protein Q8A73_009330 [Channa argus]